MIIYPLLLATVLLLIYVKLATFVCKVVGYNVTKLAVITFVVTGLCSGAIGTIVIGRINGQFTHFTGNSELIAVLGVAAFLSTLFGLVALRLLEYLNIIRKDITSVQDDI